MSIENNFAYHPADKETGKRHDVVRERCKELAFFFDDHLPDSREKALTMTKLEEVMMWANASIARNGGE